MAKMTYVGIDAVMIEAKRADATIRHRIDKALELSAGVLAEQLKKEAGSFKHPTGELAGMVKPTKIYHMADRSSIEVYAQSDNYKGRRGKPRSAATVAFVLEYGRSDMKKNPWNKRARNKTTKRINSIMEEILQ